MRCLALVLEIVSNVCGTASSGCCPHQVHAWLRARGGCGCHGTMRGATVAKAVRDCRESAMCVMCVLVKRVMACLKHNKRHLIQCL